MRQAIVTEKQVYAKIDSTYERIRSYFGLNVSIWTLKSKRKNIVNDKYGNY